jgi:hypothetical protein
MPEVYEIAWAAGVFDHGGYIKEKNRTLYMRVQFPIDRARAYRFRDIIRSGKVYGPYRSQIGLLWRYELTGRGAVSQAVGLLRPYLTHPTRYDELLLRRGSGNRGASSHLNEEASGSFISQWALP